MCTGPIDVLAPGFRFRPHQETAVRFLQGRILRGESSLVTHGVGSGKTLSALAAALAAKSPPPHESESNESNTKGKERGTTIVVVCPKALIKHWVSTATEKCGVLPDEICTSDKVRRAGGASGGAFKLMIVTYESFEKSGGPVDAVSKTSIGSVLNEIDALVLILDEAHVLRNPDSMTYKSVSAWTLRHPRSAIMALTATPVYNTIDDAVALVALLERVPVADESRVFPPSNLTDMLAPMYTVPSTELPEVTVAEVRLHLTASEAERYEETLAASGHWVLDAVRQMVHPEHGAMTKAIAENGFESMKALDFAPSIKQAMAMKLVMEHETSGNQRRVVVTCATLAVLTHTACLIKLALGNRVEVMCMHGSTLPNTQVRLRVPLPIDPCLILRARRAPCGVACTQESMLRRFSLDDDRISCMRVLVMSSEANAEGIDLSSATMMVMMDSLSEFSPMHEHQLVGRVRRPGLRWPVTIHQLCAVGTSDEIVSEMYHTPKKEHAAAFEAMCRGEGGGVSVGSLRKVPHLTHDFFLKVFRETRVDEDEKRSEKLVDEMSKILEAREAAVRSRDGTSRAIDGNGVRTFIPKRTKRTAAKRLADIAKICKRVSGSRGVAQFSNKRRTSRRPPLRPIVVCSDDAKKSAKRSVDDVLRSIREDKENEAFLVPDAALCGSDLDGNMSDESEERDDDAFDACEIEDYD